MLSIIVLKDWYLIKFENTNINLINKDKKQEDNLRKEIDDYIYYYNYDRIKVKLKELFSVNYRVQSPN